MNRMPPAAAGWALCALTLPLGAGAAPASAPASAPLQLETLEVIGRTPPGADTIRFDADALGAAATDTTRLLARAPGVEVVENGPLSGQLQVRGLFGPRIGVRLEGLHVLSGGPNWMDPPLYVAPAGLLDSVTVSRGLTGMGVGPGLGVEAEARWKRPAFSDGGVRPWLDVDARTRSVDGGTALSAGLGLAGERHRFHVAGSREEGDDYEAANRTVRPSAYDRSAGVIGYGFRGEAGELSVSWKHIESGDTGTPALPMDIEFIETDILQLEGSREFGERTVHVVLGTSTVEHGMNNFEQRPVGAMVRRTLTDVTGHEARLWLETPLADGALETGVDWRTARHDATVFDPTMPMFFLENFDDAERTLASAFAEWQRPLGPRTTGRIGARVTRTEADADEVNALPATLVDANPGAFPAGTPPRGVFALRERFNGTDRSRVDVEFDWSASLRHGLTDTLAVEGGLARRSRAAAYQERFLWIPLEATAGLADGNSYVGDPQLEPEVSHEVELALLHEGDRTQGNLRAYYRSIDGAILGVRSTDPLEIAISTGNTGDPTPLRFANVDARIHGLEGAFRWQLSDVLRLNAVGAWQRGERREDGDDPLYRIAPANGRIELTWNRRALELTVSQEFVASQDRLSAIQLDDPANGKNDFEEADAFTLTHLYASWRPRPDTLLQAGVENLLDEDWVDPLAGFVRAGGGELAFGERVPGRGRNLFARVAWSLD